MKFQHECKVGEAWSPNRIRGTGFIGYGTAAGHTTTAVQGHGVGSCFSGVEVHGVAKFDGMGVSECVYQADLNGAGHALGAVRGDGEDEDRQ